MKMYCPICYREISTTINGVIKRHGFRKDRWTVGGDRVDGKPCEGTGKIGLSITQSKPIINDLEKRS